MIKRPRATALLLVALAVAIAIAIALSPRRARAEGPAAEPTAAELATARRLFGDALAAEDQGRCAEAIPIYQRVARIAVSPVLYLRLGICSEALGHLVEALNAFELAAQEAEKKRDADVGKEARARLAALRPRVARLAVHLPDDAAGVEILIDDRPVSAALAGAPILVDPGRRHVFVRAANYEGTFEADVAAVAERAAMVNVDLGHRKAAPLAASRAAEALSPAVAAPARALPAEAPPSRLPGYVVVGVTAAVGIGALVSGIIAHDRYDEFVMMNANPRPGSHEERARLHDSGQASALASTLFTGAFLAGAGLTVYLIVSPSPTRGALDAMSRRAAFTPWAGPTGGGLVLGGDL